MKFPILASADKCTGCAACFSTCTQRAISMVSDREGFLQPVVDADKCVGCMMCARACPVKNENASSRPLACFAFQSSDTQMLRESSSGGAFSELARDVIGKGGCVFGVAWKRPELIAVHVKAENEQALSAMRGSKYVQSLIGDTYAQCQRELKTGRAVLFSGTPCQIAGLRRYLGMDYANLLTVGLICHGVPSGVVFEKFKRELSQQSKNALVDLAFRDKHFGWKEFCLSAKFKNSSCSRIINRRYNGYWRLFVTDVSMRRSCYSCAARSGRSGADILIGDFWGIEGVCSDMQIKRGVSAVLAYSQKGLVALLCLKGDRRSVTYDHVLASNPQLESNPRIDSRRAVLFEDIEKRSLLAWRRYFEYGPIWKRALRTVRHPLWTYRKFLGGI